ncbi:MAG: recombinase zinc beta ribbon domain-containing protein, partial [Candidatus Coproplasma sp.]
PLSGLMFCADCGGKMKLEYYPIKRNGEVVDIVYSYNCGCHKRLGKAYCFNHHIKAADVESILLDDIKSKANFIISDEAQVRNGYLLSQTQADEKVQAEKIYELERKKKRLEKLDLLIQGAFEEKLEGKIPEDVCLKMIEKYSAERQQLSEEVRNQTTEEKNFQQAGIGVDEFIDRIKNHINDVSVTRELCLELIDKIVIGGNPSVTGKPQDVEIFYKIG